MHHAAGRGMCGALAGSSRPGSQRAGPLAGTGWGRALRLSHRPGQTHQSRLSQRRILEDGIEAVAPPTRQRGWRFQGGVPLAGTQGRGAPGRGPGAAPPAPGQRPSRRICGSYRIPAPPGSPSLRLLVPRSPGSPPIGSEKRAGAAARPRTRDSGGVEPMGAVTWTEPPAAAHAVEPTSRTPQEPHCRPMGGNGGNQNTIFPMTHSTKNA